MKPHNRLHIAIMLCLIGDSQINIYQMKICQQQWMRISAFNVFILNPNRCQKNVIHELNTMMNMVTPKRFVNHSRCVSLSFPFNVEQTGNKKFPMGLLIKEMLIHRNHYQLLNFITLDMITHECFNIGFHLGLGSGKCSRLLQVEGYISNIQKLITLDVFNCCHSFHPTC